MRIIDQKKLQTSRNKKFCGEMAIICAAVGIYMQIRHHGNAFILCTLAAIFVLLYLLRPGLANGFRKGWEYLGETLGAINSTIVLCLTYFIVLTPMAILLRLCGRNALEPKFDKKKQSYWKEPDTQFSMKNQY